jgi:long-chain acyl-CoA synthetase
LVIDPEAAAAWGQHHGVPDATAQHPELRAAVQAHVDAVNAKFAKVEWVREWRILPRPLGIDTGELTPTLKVKRKKVEEHFASILDEIYAGGE